MSIKEIYLNGIVIAKSWLQEAQLDGNPLLVETFQRILDKAVDEYKGKFGNE